MVVCCNILGGLSSYILIQMILAFANLYATLPPIEELFMSFLQYYGYIFKTNQMYIVNGECIAMQVEENLQPDELVVVDMFNPSTNAAASVTKFGEIKLLFQKVFNDLQNDVTTEITAHALISN